MSGTRDFYANGCISGKTRVLLVLGFVLLLMNVIIFIIRVLKLLFMHAKYFFLVFVVIMAAISPAAGSLTKISAGAPVYIGEQNLDISSGLQGCRVIAWWANGTDTNAAPSKNVTIIQTLEESGIAFRYSIDPAIYSGYTGIWYCEGKRPLVPVFEVVQPHLSIRFWDLDKNEDITGKTVSLNTNITYRVETNLDRALQYKYRPDVTPLDSFFTVTLTDSRGNVLQSLYSGSYGKADTYVKPFESKPYISASPYFWKDAGTWDLESRNAQGDSLYPAGTYSLTIQQNLNHMETVYTGISTENRAGLLEASAAVTFTKPEFTPVKAFTTPQATPSVTAAASPDSTPAPSLTYVTIPANRTTVPTKTTYAPLPFWIVLAGLGIAFACAALQRK
jgi:hypothetical protein